MVDKKSCKNILVAVDFSGDSIEAVNQALVLGGILEADLFLLHVIHEPVDVPGFYSGKVGKKTIKRLDDRASEMMTEFIKKNDFTKRAKALKVGLSATCATGIPEELIVKQAQKKRFCMVMLGTSGRSGLSHVLMGSVAERVVQRCPCPVMVVKAPVKQKNK